MGRGVVRWGGVGVCVCVCVAKPVAVELRCHATALICFYGELTKVIFYCFIPILYRGVIDTIFCSVT